MLQELVDQTSPSLQHLTHFGQEAVFPPSSQVQSLHWKRSCFPASQPSFMSTVSTPKTLCNEKHTKRFMLSTHKGDSPFHTAPPRPRQWLEEPQKSIPKSQWTSFNRALLNQLISDLEKVHTIHGSWRHAKSPHLSFVTIASVSCHFFGRLLLELRVKKRQRGSSTGGERMVCVLLNWRAN